MSAIISSQITDTDSEDTTVDLGDENVELRIDIGMVFLLMYFLLHLCFFS